MDSNYNDYTSYDNSLYNEVRVFLHDEEQILWIGKPCQSAKVPISPFLVIFSIFWLGFAVFWTVMATIIDGFFGLFGIPFLCIGVYLAYTVTIGQNRKYQKTTYVVTDKRALIVYRGYRGSTCIDHYFNRLQNISILHINGNVGTICFEPTYYGYNYGSYQRYGRHSVGYEYKTSFVMIDNVHEVYRIISEHISMK